MPANSEFLVIFMLNCLIWTKLMVSSNYYDEGVHGFKARTFVSEKSLPIRWGEGQDERKFVAF